MPPRRASMGFNTPSKAMNDAFASVQEQLAQNKANWKAIGKIPELVLAEMKANKVGKPSSSDAYHLLFFAMFAQLGVEINETHERLSKVEKSVKDLTLQLSLTP